VEGLRKTTSNVRTANVPTEIQMDHLPDTSQESYHFSQLVTALFRSVCAGFSSVQMCVCRVQLCSDMCAGQLCSDVCVQGSAVFRYMCAGHSSVQMCVCAGFSSVQIYSSVQKCVQDIALFRCVCAGFSSVQIYVCRVQFCSEGMHIC
jgi:hypothetical protein